MVSYLSMASHTIFRPGADAALVNPPKIGGSRTDLVRSKLWRTIAINYENLVRSEELVGNRNVEALGALGGRTASSAGGDEVAPGVLAKIKIEQDDIDRLGGAMWVDQNIIRQLAERVAQQDSVQPSRVQLTEREQQVLQGVFEGLANKEFGARIGISEAAVKSNLQQLFRKTRVRTRSQLVRVALEGSFAAPRKDS